MMRAFMKPLLVPEPKDRKFPGRSWNVFNALSRVVPSHLMDRELFDFVGLKPTGVPDAGGDIAFDEPADDEQACGAPVEEDAAGNMKGIAEFGPWRRWAGPLPLRR
jgi:hypothetical protein